MVRRSANLGYAGSGRDLRWWSLLGRRKLEAGEPLDLIRRRERKPDDQVDLADLAVAVAGLEPVAERGSLGYLRCAFTGVDGELDRLQARYSVACRSAASTAARVDLLTPPDAAFAASGPSTRYSSRQSSKRVQRSVAASRSRNRRCSIANSPQSQLTAMSVRLARRRRSSPRSERSGASRSMACPNAGSRGCRSRGDVRSAVNAPRCAYVPCPSIDARTRRQR